MTIKNHLLTLTAAISLLFASCKKDAILESQDATTGTVSSDATANDVVETAPPVYTGVVTNVNANVAGFWQAVPARYNLTTKKYPLILFIHGIGELGTGISRMNCCGLPKHLYNKSFPANFNVGGANYSFVVMAPQFKVRPSAADMQSVIDYAKKRFRIDETRIYVAGLSMGGGSTWDYSAVYGQNAAAIVPVCGGTRPSVAMSQSIASKNLPIWGLYSTADAVVPVQWGKDFFTWIDQYNPGMSAKTKLTIWTDVDHNATWGRAFNPTTKVDGYNIYEWMLLNKRSATSAPAPTPTPTPTPVPGNTAPIANAGADRSVPKSWNWFPELNASASKDADGYIAKASWTQVSGPSTATYANQNAVTTKIGGLIVGSYTFKVAITDNKGAVAYDQVIFTVTNN